MGIASAAGNVKNEEDIVHIVDFALDTFGAIVMFCPPTPASPLKQPIKPPLRNGNDLSTSFSSPTYSQPNTCFRTCLNGEVGIF